LINHENQAQGITKNTIQAHQAKSRKKSEWAANGGAITKYVSIKTTGNKVSQGRLLKYTQ
jgi:hypothetical protein